MEVTETNEPAWLDENHPNYARWKRARSIAEERGKFVVSIIEQQIKCDGLTVLDLGSGEGGTTKILAKNNNVFSIDISLTRLLRQADHENNLYRVNGDALRVPLKNESFELIILQDVIEHVKSPAELIDSLYTLLKKDGILYLSTPNRFSMFNFIADPHWGMPFVSVLKRETIKKYFLKNFRKNDSKREDAAQLLSLYELDNIFKNKFEIKLNTKFAVEKLLEGNKGIVWSDLHLNLLEIIRKIHLQNFILSAANNNYGFTNNFLNPTFYFLLKKK
jgi:SAM-dependent methyltransferase